MPGTDHRKQSLYFPEEMLLEIQHEATRQDRSLSWIVQQAWKVARGDIQKMPSVNDVTQFLLAVYVEPRPLRLGRVFGGVYLDVRNLLNRENVVAVMSERNLGRAVLLREAIQNPAPEPRAERAVRLSFRDLVGDDRVGVLFDHPEVVLLLAHVVAEAVGGVAGMALVDVDDDQLHETARVHQRADGHRRALIFARPSRRGPAGDAQTDG